MVFNFHEAVDLIFNLKGFFGFFNRFFRHLFLLFLSFSCLPVSLSGFIQDMLVEEDMHDCQYSESYSLA